MWGLCSVSQHDGRHAWGRIQYWYPTHPVLHEWSVLFFLPATMLFANLFTVSFLNLKIIAPKLAFLFRIYLVLSFLCMLGAFSCRMVCRPESPFSW